MSAASAEAAVSPMGKAPFGVRSMTAQHILQLTFWTCCPIIHPFTAFDVDQKAVYFHSGQKNFVRVTTSNDAMSSRAHCTLYSPTV